MFKLCGFTALLFAGLKSKQAKSGRVAPKGLGFGRLRGFNVNGSAGPPNSSKQKEAHLAQSI